MLTTFLKTSAIAATLIVATAGAASAASAYIDHNSQVRLNHSNGAPIVNHVAEGDHVKILGHWGNWYKIKIPGQDGWVKASSLDFGGGYGGGYYDTDYYGGGGSGISACFGGDHGSFCFHD